MSELLSKIIGDIFLWSSNILICVKIINTWNFVLKYHIIINLTYYVYVIAGRNGEGKDVIKEYDFTYVRMVFVL